MVVEPISFPENIVSISTLHPLVIKMYIIFEFTAKETKLYEKKT